MSKVQNKRLREAIVGRAMTRIRNRSKPLDDLAVDSQDTQNHVFTCVRCSRQWTVVSNDKLECFFSGLCYWCLRETGTTQEDVRSALVATTGAGEGDGAR
jgi:hypothetical protein